MTKSTIAGMCAAALIVTGVTAAVEIVSFQAINNAYRNSVVEVAPGGSVKILALDPRNTHVPKDNVNRGPRKNMPGQRQHQ